jgi:hypothetical protein
MLNRINGSLLVLTSFTRFFQIFFDPIGNQVFFMIFEDFSGNNIFSLLGGVVIAIGIYLGLAIIIGYLYSSIYFAEGVSNFVLSKDKSNVKSVIALTLISGILEFRALVILAVNDLSSFLILFHFVIDIIILSGSISIYMKISKRKRITKEETGKISEEFAISLEEVNARECLNTVTLDCLNVEPV